MKKLLYFALPVMALLVAWTWTSPKTAGDTAAAPSFKWTKTVHDFGQIKQGAPQTAIFEFTNIGNSPLILSAVNPSCGCTVPEYTKDPIAPGKTGTIKATYNAAAMGNFNKSITVMSNVGEPVVLFIKGEVVQ
ncbi:DUF1573 domain-containing protein [Eisenibacter elegans]|jgi:hypothetical protein|uniref:DUF1573 domain-containing protein n=1 Tax=Eisenibacter elegans TaxID=997 RepID=UPI00040AF0D9|nr:DUF1573 domain-containing protein [Eisenibacter elegans]